MKYKLILILSILALLTNANVIFADENEFDITGWTYKSLTEKSDQNDDVKVCKYYYYYQPENYAFCIESNQKFEPKNAKYSKEICTNENIFKIAKAYDQIGKQDDNYFIAAQLLIWEESDGISYTFNGNDYKEYKQEIIDQFNPKQKLLANKENRQIKARLNEEVLIDEDFSEYEIKGEGIKILQNNSEGFRFIVEELEPVEKTISFKPKNNMHKHSLKLSSENSQDLYYYDGEYEELKSFEILVETLNDKNCIYFSKKDEDGNYIEGAEFSLFELEAEDSNNELVFIQNNTDINLFEALLDDRALYEDLKIEISERYSVYLNGEIINTKELGYFSYEIYDKDELIKKGNVFVSDDIEQTNNTYSRFATKRIYTGYSDNLLINSINNLNSEKSYYLCETEPKKGYEYVNNPCTLVDMTKYDNEVFEFTNKRRDFTLRLMKESPEKILLNGAKFKIIYSFADKEIEKTFITGSMQIDRVNNNKYLFIRKDGETEVKIVEFEDEKYIDCNIEPGKYYYYQSNDEIVNNSLLYKDYFNVIDGGYDIDDIPYFANITIEELEAPKGYVINDPIFVLKPDVEYSDITFKNYRVNCLDIIPGKKFIVPKTCIN